MSLTSANSIIMLAIPGVFTTPQQLQGFSADDVFDTESIEIGETLMGVDGVLSGGWVNNPVNQSFSLQADSPSNAIFDAWYQAERTIQDKYPASAVITLPSLQMKYTMSTGFMISYPVIAPVRKILQPRRFMLRWKSAIPARTVVS